MLKSLQAIETYREEGRLPGEGCLWLEYIAQAEQTIVNLERVESLGELEQQSPVLDYVERSLRVLDSLPLSYWIRELAEETLIWSETAKGVRSGSAGAGRRTALIYLCIISVRHSCTGVVERMTGRTLPLRISG